MKTNINTPDYWEKRFATEDWEQKGGRWQTRSFSLAQIRFLGIPKDFTGSILDFGCGLGDAMRVYREAFPQAKLIGVDISQAAIEKCRQNYGTLASFEQGDHKTVPEVDIIIASNVLEHLSTDKEVARLLAMKCKRLYVIVPYEESPLCLEHVNRYDLHAFDAVGGRPTKVFCCRGWSQYGLRLFYYIYVKNIFRLFTGTPLRYRSRQVMFQFESGKAISSSYQTPKLNERAA